MSLRVLMVTSEWPTPERPDAVPFLVRRVEALREVGVDVEVDHFHGGARPGNYLKVNRWVRARIRSGLFDVAHAQFGQSGLALMPSPLPWVVTFRGSDLEGIVSDGGRYTMRGRVLVMASRLVARRADQVILVSESLASKLPGGVSYRIVPSGVDLGLFSPGSKEEARRRLGLPQGETLVLFSGRPERPVKRYWLAEQAVGLLPRELKARLVGVSGLTPAAVADHMRACDILLLTSRHEGSPPMVREALACSLPVVAVDVGDVRKWIQGLTGCCLSEDDRPSTIASALRRALAYKGPFDGRSRMLDVDERRLALLDVEAYRDAIQQRGATVR